MGLFTKRDPQHDFDGYGFEVTDVLLEPPRLTLLPCIYQDAKAERWAVKYRHAEPSFFAYADVLDAAVVESGDAAGTEEHSKQEMAQQILLNPALATRQMATKHKICTGMGVRVLVKIDANKASELEIPVMVGDVKRDTALYTSYRAVAERLCAAFLAMKDSTTGA